MKRLLALPVLILLFVLIAAPVYKARIGFLINSVVGIYQVVNIPVATQEFYDGNGFFRTKVDLVNATEVRLVILQFSGSSSGSELAIEYSANGVDFLGDLVFVPLSTGTAQVDSGWVSIPSAARANSMFLRTITRDGDGAADPFITNITVYAR